MRIDVDVDLDIGPVGKANATAPQTSDDAGTVCRADDDVVAAGKWLAGKCVVVESGNDTVTAVDIQRAVVSDAAGADCVCECDVVASGCVFVDVVAGGHFESTAPSLGQTDPVPLAGNTAALADGTAEERIGDADCRDMLVALSPSELCWG